MKTTRTMTAEQFAWWARRQAAVHRPGRQVRPTDRERALMAYLSDRLADATDVSEVQEIADQFPRFVWRPCWAARRWPPRRIVIVQ